MGLRVIRSILLFVLVLSSTVAQACTTRTMLDLIGSLEAPEGYDQVYSGSVIPTPRPLTAMTVREVLEWQDLSVEMGSDSSAAGRYQIIRDTLRGLVRQGVVGMDEIYSTQTQDRLGAHLLAQTGYRDGVRDAGTANRIAGVWAALPAVSGPNAGDSVYEGVIDNHARIDANSFASVMSCGMGLEEALRNASIVTVGLNVGLMFDTFLENLVSSGSVLMENMAHYILPLLFFFLTIEIVVSFARIVITGDTLETAFRNLAYLFAAVGFCYWLTLNLSDVVGWFGNKTAEIARDAQVQSGFGLGSYARDKAGVMVNLMTQARAFGMVERFLTTILVIALTFTTAIAMATVVLGYARLYFTAAGASILISGGAAGFSREQFYAYVTALIAGALRIIFLLVGIHLALSLAQGATGINPVTGGVMILIVDILAVILLMTLPSSASKLIRLR